MTFDKARTLAINYTHCYGALTFWIRWNRIIKHYLLYKITSKPEHWYETEHYLAMKKFSRIIGVNAP
jgi:hypothetical protein